MLGGVYVKGLLVLLVGCGVEIIDVSVLLVLLECLMSGWCCVL